MAENPLNNIKPSTDFLDKALLMLKEESPFGPTDYVRPRYSSEEKKLLRRAFYKLEKDGYAFSEKTTSPNLTDIRFYISYDGLLALEDCPSRWQNRPYTWASHKKNQDAIWTVAKTAAVAINALVVLYFTYLTYMKDSANSRPAEQKKINSSIQVAKPQKPELKK